MRRKCILALMLLTLCISAQGEGQIPSGGAVRSFEEVLSAKGLKRFARTYILKDTEARDAKAQGFAKEIETLEAEFRPLFEERNRRKQRVKYAEARISDRGVEEARREYDRLEEKGASLAERGMAYVRLSSAEREKEAAKVELAEAKADHDAFESQYRRDFDRYSEETWRIQKASVHLVNETKRIYAALMVDPEVKKAIRTHNRDRRPKVVLGPVGSESEYLAIIRKDNFDLLREKGIVFDPNRNRFFLAAELKVSSLAFETRKLLDKLNEPEKPQAGRVRSKYERFIEQKKAVMTKAPTGTNRERSRQSDALKELDAQIDQLPPGSRDPGAAERERADTAADLRKRFLAAMRDFRRAAFEAPTARQLADNDREVNETIEELSGAGGKQRGKGKSSKIAEAPNYRQSLTSLKEFEKAVRLESLPQELGPDGGPTIPVTLDGGVAARMSIDPEAKTTILPATLAATIGVIPDRQAPRVALIRDGGVMVMTRPALLRAVRVGSIKVENVPCLVLPADAPLEPLPLLGTEVLDRLGAEVVSDDKVVLMEFIPAPAKLAEARGRN